MILSAISRTTVPSFSGHTTDLTQPQRRAKRNIRIAQKHRTRLNPHDLRLRRTDVQAEDTVTSMLPQGQPRREKHKPPSLGTILATVVPGLNGTLNAALSRVRADIAHFATMGYRYGESPDNAGKRPLPPHKLRRVIAQVLPDYADNERPTSPEIATLLRSSRYWGQTTEGAKMLEDEMTLVEARARARKRRQLQPSHN